MKTVLTVGSGQVSQCQKPRGWLGRFVLWNMNYRHSKATDWGLGHVCVEKDFTILDVGCGGGRTLSKLATAATQGKVYGIDYSKESVAVTKRMNARWLEMGRVEVRQASVSHLPFQDGMFDLVTAVETHFWWPDLAADMHKRPQRQRYIERTRLVALRSPRSSPRSWAERLNQTQRHRTRG
jgi:SAM-dependent methyltransferase